jgi:cyclic pyranopterin phosphate synthase
VASSEFTHLDGDGHAHMVDVTAKPATFRRAVARCWLAGLPEPEALVTADGHFGEVLEEARIAGIMGGGRTSTLVPLCHPIGLTALDVGFEIQGGRLHVNAVAETVGQTGVEMEALTACAVAALAVVAALPVDPTTVSVDGLALWHKTGGRSGTFERPVPPEIPAAAEPDSGPRDAGTMSGPPTSPGGRARGGDG